MSEPTDPWQVPTGPPPPPAAPVPPPPGDWAAPEYGYGWVPVAPQRTNPWSIVSLVTGILSLVPVAIVTGIVALVQVSRRQEKGRGLAIAGLCLAGFWSLVVAAVVVAGVNGAFTTQPSDNELGQISDAGSTSVGSCLLAPTDSSNYSQPVDCDEDHDAEVYLVDDLGSSSYPGADELDTRADRQCSRAFEPYVGSSHDESSYDYGFFVPSRHEWDNGEHRVICTVISGDNKAMRGSVKNSGD